MNADFAAALVAAQTEMKNPQFDSVNPHFQSKFASLKAVRAAVIPAMNKHGIAVVQQLVSDDNGAGVQTTLIHESGETLQCPPFILPASKHDPQGHGSAISYARRYDLQAIAGVVGDEDDDGNAAQEAAQPKPATDEQIAVLDDYLEAGAMSDNAEWYKANRDKLTEPQAAKIIAKLRAA